MAIAALCLAACSEKTTEEVQTPSEPLVVETLDEGYLGFGLSLPTLGAGTRANDDFNDGDAAEYAVKTGVLVLFNKAENEAEGEATFCGAYDLGNNNALADFNPISLDGTSVQCTTHGIVVQKIDNTVITKAQLYGYVIINPQLQFMNIGPKELTVVTNNGNAEVSDATTFNQFSQYVLTKIGGSALGFVMTNAPVNSAAGGDKDPSGTVTTLTRFDMGKIKSTESAAKADVAGEVFVERSAVKVTVSKGGSLSGTAFQDGTTTQFDPNFTWILGNENSIYYNTRQYKTSWLSWVNNTDEATTTSQLINPHRFVSGGPIHDGVYRTYWAEDVNYNTDAGFTGAPASDQINKAPDANAYTFENTFDVDHMTFKNTTYVALKVKFNNGEDFYTSTFTGNKVILKTTKNAEDDIDCIEEAIHEYLKVNSEDYVNYITTGSYDASNLIVTMNTPATGKAIAKVASINGAGTFPVSVTPELINNAITFRLYRDGLAYYTVRLKHFGADQGDKCETPWNVERHATNSVQGAYKEYVVGTTKTPYTAGETDNHFTGRYGVVRNNWYQLSIEGIRAIGTPMPINPNDGPDPENPDPDKEHPDDEVESYIGVKIHVLPWALRKQGAIL